MNTRTMGEKWAELFENIKLWTVRVLLIAWAFITFALGISYGLERRRSDELERRLDKIESMSSYDLSELKDVKVIYIHK